MTNKKLTNVPENLEETLTNVLFIRRIDSKRFVEKHMFKIVFVMISEVNKRIF